MRMWTRPLLIEEISKVFLEELDAALENEGREDVGAARVVEVAQEVREQGVLVSASTDKGRCVGGCQGGKRRQRGPGPHPLA